MWSRQTCRHCLRQPNHVETSTVATLVRQQYPHIGLGIVGRLGGQLAQDAGEADHHVAVDVR